MVYRTVGMMDGRSAESTNRADATKECCKAIEEYAVECSIIKVLGVGDARLRGRRDACRSTAATASSRSIRPSAPIATRASTASSKAPTKSTACIITGWLLKRAMSGQLAADARHQEADGRSDGRPVVRGSWKARWLRNANSLSNAKKLALFVAGAASQKYMQKLADQQEIMGAIADMVIEAFTMDSCLLRARKFIETQGEQKAALVTAMTQIYIAGAMTRLEASAKKVIAAVAEGDMMRTQMAIVRRLVKFEPVNVIALQEQVAARMLETGKYTTV